MDYDKEDSKTCEATLPLIYKCFNEMNYDKEDPDDYEATLP